MSENIETALQLQKSFTEHGLTLALAESCTGGALAETLTANSGASGFFRGGAVVYDNSVKVRILGVPELLLAKFGAVSEECARAMADGALRRFDADVALSITGIAGPSGAVPGKPVGTVCMALARRGCEEIEARTFHFGGDRGAIRKAGVEAALHMLAGVTT